MWLHWVVPAPGFSRGCSQAVSWLVSSEGFTGVGSPKLAWLNPALPAVLADGGCWSVLPGRPHGPAAGSPQEGDRRGGDTASLLHLLFIRNEWLSSATLRGRGIRLDLFTEGISRNLWTYFKITVAVCLNLIRKDLTPKVT